ncbi:aldehyde dehydrogenase [Endozoicomonas sp. SM1973]|uniref:Aldehyde dehydrogenase n=1 Tax=Spartinivicinus marinus TaxID=2994442 RepID=A0A853I5N6_9GAMM|nr:aldehyde dehydrogenase [Spartinivicinus marinus]MCX4029707.1 aldehyde dehydrogenase [Spartinivicinus marinus]NYZ66912.1 aldehyde dehydrogenase [Spartinivicinus marinus]
MDTLANYINGQLTNENTDNYLENINPATGEVYSLLPNSNLNQLNTAIAAATSAQPAWEALGTEGRSYYLNRLADKIAANLDQLAAAETEDTGKPIALATSLDIPRAASNFRFFAQAISQFASESHNMGNQAINYTLRDPLGVVGCISPWNLPLYLLTWKIAPALAAGNSVIAKPSELAPKTAYLLSQLCIDIGLPDGVLNILHGQGNKIGQAIIEHPQIKAISFTGGTKTGQIIAASAAPQFKKLSLELGGKNPALVFADCDFDKTIDGIIRASFTNQGQVCMCSSRIYIEQSIYPSFKQALLKKIQTLAVGDPLTDVILGALISKDHQEKVLAYIRLAQQEGGTIVCGGTQYVPTGRCEGGFFITPTVIEGLSIDARVNQEEIFGPVITLQPFNSEQEALALANGTNYGLAATVWTENLTRMHRLAKQLDVGVVWANSWMLRDLRTPLGGVKNSGLGREGGWEALRFFTEPKNVCIPY